MQLLVDLLNASTASGLGQALFFCSGLVDADLNDLVLLESSMDWLASTISDDWHNVPISWQHDYSS